MYCIFFMAGGQWTLAKQKSVKQKYNMMRLAHDISKLYHVLSFVASRTPHSNICHDLDRLFGMQPPLLVLTTGC